MAQTPNSLCFSDGSEDECEVYANMDVNVDVNLLRRLAVFGHVLRLPIQVLNTIAHPASNNVSDTDSASDSDETPNDDLGDNPDNNRPCDELQDYEDEEYEDEEYECEQGADVEDVDVQPDQETLSVISTPSSLGDVSPVSEISDTDSASAASDPHDDSCLDDNDNCLAEHTAKKAKLTG